jgi:hypothetical protein
MTIDSLSVDRALRVINNLQQTLEQARKENRYLRSRTEEKHPYHINTSGRILRRALDDGTAILVLRYSGYPVGRGYCHQLGYSERRYFWAMGLLRSARVVSARGSRWLVDDFVTAEAKVKASYERLKDQPNALEMVRLYMPRKMQYMYKSRDKV